MFENTRPSALAVNVEVAELVAELRHSRDVGDRKTANRLFADLSDRVRPTLRKFALNYAADTRRTPAEVGQECLLCLDACVSAYTTEKAARIPFEAFLGMRLNKHLSRAYHLSRTPFAGTGVKLLRKVSALAQKARADGVDGSDAQAICDHAVANGARRTIIRRHLPLLAGVLSLHAPVRHASGGEAQVIDFIAESTESAESLDPEVAHRAANLLLSLPVSQRRVLERLHGLDGGEPSSLVDIARAEGVTAGSIAERRDRAMKRLRQAMISPTQAAA